MRAVVQRVTSSQVQVDGKVIGRIDKGLNILVAVSKGDTIEDVKLIKDKIINLRIFEDNDEKMNLSLLDVSGELLVVSQFTLYGDCRKGRRPSFIESESGEKAKELYDTLVKLLREDVKKVETGEFGADMQVYIQNDGPVTLLLDSKKVF
ncbi:MAG: D-tyrosyl-tRNA(Tyr) deacylase [Bacillota bacterium]|nr:D-tyrosyl-tRNA(Tyr) deacylase [Bacillota bacterium]